MALRITAEVSIERPRGDVCAVLLDPAAAPEWMANLERFEVVSGHGGQPGAHARLHYVQNGRRIVMNDVLLEADPGRRYVSDVRGRGLRAQVEILLESADRGTALTMSWEGTGTRLATRILLRLFRRRIERGIAGDLASLKRLVEGRCRPSA